MFDGVRTKKKNYSKINPFQIRDIDLFSDLTDDEFLRLNDTSSLTCGKRGTIIYYEGRQLAGVYCLLKGVVKIYKTGISGKEQIIRFASKGNIIGYRSLLTGELACTSSKVIENSVICYIPNNTLQCLFEQNWKFRQKVMKMMCKELKESNDFILEVTSKSIRGRIAEKILFFKDEYGVDEYNTLNIKISRVEFANMIGIASESVIRILREFSYKQLIKLDQKNITILNNDDLKLVANNQLYKSLYEF